MGGERGGCVHRVVERALTATARLRERVEEDDDVGVALRVRLVHPGLTAPRSRAPVHAPHPVARDERAQVGELDPFAMRARQLVPGERLRLERAQQLLQRLPAGVHLQGPPSVERLLKDEQAERVVGAQDELADEVGTPALAAYDVLQLAPLPRVEPQQLRVGRLGDEPFRQVEQELEPGDRRLGAQLELQLNWLPSTCRSVSSSSTPERRGVSASERPTTRSVANGAASAASSGRPRMSAASNPAPASAA